MDGREEIEEQEELEDYEEYEENDEYSQVDDEYAEDDDWYYEEPEDSEFYHEDEEETAMPESFYEHDPDNEWSVVTQGFYEQYGAEIQASVRDISGEELLEEYEDESEYEDEEAIYQKPKKKRKKKHYLRKIMGFIVLLALIAAIGLSPIFNIKTINVKGTENNDPKEIIKSSGVKVGDNIFKTRRSNVEEALKKNAYLSSVDIERKLPSTLTIVVKERKESAFIAYGSEFIVLDSRGFILRNAEKKPKLTELTNIKITDKNIGEKIGVKDSETFERILDIVEAMDDADLFFKKIALNGVIVRAYIKDNFLCKGQIEHVIKNMKNGNIRTILDDLSKKNKKKGTIIITDDKYCSYSPKVE